MLRPIAKSNIYEAVIQQIRTGIEDGSWPPGSRLPSERDLAQVLNVGRTSVREALRALQAMDLIEVRPGEGTFVRQRALPLAEERIRSLLEDKAIAELYEVRDMLESQTAALAAERATTEDIRAMEAALAEATESVRTGRDCLEEDLAFHMAVARSADNEVVSQVLAMLWDRLRPAIEQFLQVPGRPQRALAEHRTVLEAIRSGDVAATRECMLRHLHSRFSEPTGSAPETE